VIILRFRKPANGEIKGVQADQKSLKGALTAYGLLIGLMLLSGLIEPIKQWLYQFSMSRKKHF